jgi:hypothetical protein
VSARGRAAVLLEACRPVLVGAFGCARGPRSGRGRYPRPVFCDALARSYCVVFGRSGGFGRARGGPDNGEGRPVVGRPALRWGVVLCYAVCLLSITFLGAVRLLVVRVRAVCRLVRRYFRCRR